MSYTPVHDTVIISTFYNSELNPYRLKAFYNWYKSIQGLNYRILEVAVGDQPFQLPLNDPNIKHIRTNSLYWFKESALNTIISELPKHFTKIAWVDSDLKFTNKDWLLETSKLLDIGYTVVQPFEYAIHLEQDKYEPLKDIEEQRKAVQIKNLPNRRIWKGFVANYGTRPKDYVYELEGVCGFVWAARRKVLENVPFFAAGLSLDHLFSHFSVGDFPAVTGHKNNCIEKSSFDNIEAIYEYAARLYKETKGLVGFVGGDILHEWHGPLVNRQYLQRTQDWTKVAKTLSEKDENGLFIHENDEYMRKYFKKKEVSMHDSWYNWFMWYYYKWLIKLEF